MFLSFDAKVCQAQLDLGMPTSQSFGAPLEREQENL